MEILIITRSLIIFDYIRDQSSDHHALKLIVRYATGSKTLLRNCNGKRNVIGKTCFYIRRCMYTWCTYILSFPFAIRTSVMCTSVETCVPDAMRRRQRFTHRMVQRQARSLRSAARQIKRTKVHVLDFEFRH